MSEWVSVDNKPVPFDCDVVICHKSHIYSEELKTWERGVVVSLARAWVAGFGSLRATPYGYWNDKPSFVTWPYRILVTYTEITHWMLADELPQLPKEKD